MAQSEAVDRRSPEEKISAANGTLRGLIPSEPRLAFQPKAVVIDPKQIEEAQRVSSGEFWKLFVSGPVSVAKKAYDALQTQTRTTITREQLKEAEDKKKLNQRLIQNMQTRAFRFVEARLAASRNIKERESILAFRNAAFDFDWSDPEKKDVFDKFIEPVKTLTDAYAALRQNP